MRRTRLVSAGILTILVAGCATPEGVKEASRRQGELLGEFQRSAAALRTRLLEYYDASIDEFQADLLDARLRADSPRVTAALEGALRGLDPGLSEEAKAASVRRYLNQASNYLVQLRTIYFSETYCDQVALLRPEFLKGAETPCDARHVAIANRLRQARGQVAGRFDRLAQSVSHMEEAHGLLDRYLQIEFKLTRERVEAAKAVIREAKQTVEEARDAFGKLRQPGP